MASRFLLTPIGSGGDVRPFVDVGRELSLRGHEVTVLAAEPFEQMVREAGLGFVAIWSKQDYEREALDPDLWHPRKGFRLMMRILGENLDKAWEMLESSVPSGRVVLVAHTLSFATRAFAEKKEIPHATVHLSPTVFRSRFEQPRAVPELDLNRLPRFLIGPFWRLIDRMLIDPAIAPALNRFRRKHDLAPVSRVFCDSIHSPDLVVALFSEWFAPPQPDWPTQTRLAGFPIRPDPAQPLENGLTHWIEENGAPVVFTAGTANFQAGEFFATAVGVAKRIDRPVLLLTTWREQIPDDLPSNVRHVDFAPFASLLPRCAALVHHGGIGTCAHGLAGGIPQLVMPMAFDQPDNAERLAKLGVGDQVPPSRFRPDRVATELTRLLESDEVADACRGLRAKMEEHDGIAAAATALESILRDRAEADSHAVS